MGVLELHDATTYPGVSRWAGVPVHRSDVVAAACEGGAEQEPGRARSHDECAHDPVLHYTGRYLITLRVT